MEGKIIISLYEDVIELLQEARERISNKEIEATHDLLEKARNIMVGLLLSLDKRGKETAEKLKSLYWFIFTKIVEANYKKDIYPIDHVLVVLQRLKEGYIPDSEFVSPKPLYNKKKAKRHLNKASVIS